MNCKNKFTIKKPVIILIALALIVSSCKNKDVELTRVGAGKSPSNNDTEYYLENSRFSKYTNLYYDNGLLQKSNIETTFANEFGFDVSHSEELFFYDNKNNLIRKETFVEIFKGDKELSSIKIYSNNTEETVMFTDFPNDTAYYSYSLKNEIGQIIEEHDCHNVFDKEVFFRKYDYDNQGRVSIIETNNLTTGLATQKTYQYKTVKDTLITHIFENGLSAVMIKEFMKDSTKIVVSSNFIDNGFDTLYIEKNKIKSVIYFENLKMIDIEKLDNNGNILEKEYKHWRK